MNAKEGRIVLEKLLYLGCFLGVGRRDALNEKIKSQAQK